MPEEKGKVTQPKTEDPIDKLLKRVDSGESFAYLKDQEVSLPGYSTASEMNKFGESKHDKPLTEQYFQTQAGDKQKPFEYQRAAEQSNWDKAANGTLRLAGRALTSGAEGILTPFVGTFSAIKDGKFSSFYDNPVTKGLDEIDKSIKESLPLYDTREAEQAHGIDKLKYANTLFGDIFDGIGYSIGAIGVGGAYTKFAQALAKTAIVGKTTDFLSKLTSIEGASDKLKYIDLVNTLNKVSDGMKNGTIAFIGATAESSANARSDKNEFKEMMTKELSQNGTRELTDGEKQYVEMLAEKVGNNSFMLNIPTIMLDNWITFGKAVFGNKLTDKSNLLGIADNVEAKALDSYTLSKRFIIDGVLDKTYGLRQAVKPFMAEGTQEQLQYAISKGTNDYFRKRYYNPEAASVIESISKGLSEAYGTAEGWDNFLIGSLSGGLFGNAINLKQSGLESYQNPDEKLTAQGLATLNSISSKDTYKTLIESAMTHGNILDEQTKALERGDDFEYENTKNDMFHNYVSTRIKTGKLEDLYKDLEQFKSMSPEDIKSNFGLELGTDELTGMKQSVSGFVNNKIKQAQNIERAYNIISERFPDISSGVKDRLAYAAISIENAKERRHKLSQEVSKIVSDNTYRIANPTELSSLGVNYASLTEPAAKELYLENLKNSSISPMDQDEITKKIKDIDKLTKREKDFVDEYKELAKPDTQSKLAEQDSKAEAEINDAVNKAGEDETEDTTDFEDNGFEVDEEAFIKGLADQENEQKRKEENISKKADIERRRQEDLDANKGGFRTKVEKYTTLDVSGESVEVEITTYQDGSRVLKARAYNKDGSLDPMAYVTERINNKAQLSLSNEKLVEGYIGNEELKKVSEDTNIRDARQDKINAKYDAELAALKTTSPITETLPVDDTTAVSTSVTKTNNQNVTEDTPLDKLANNIAKQIPADGKSIAAISNLAIGKLFEGSTGVTGNFNWKRDQDGFVIRTNSAISLDINKPNVAKEGDKLIFKVTKLDEESEKRNQASIEYSKKEIAKSIADGNPFNYTEEDKNFTGAEYTETIGIFTEDGTLVGYVQLPQWINPIKNLKKDSQGVDPALYEEARKRVLAERKLILDKLSKGEEVSTTVSIKGTGNPLTRLNKDNTPYTSGNLITEAREQDKFNNRPVFVFDNGSGFTIPGTQEVKDEYKSFVASLPTFGQRGKIFQVVKTANGKNGLIPVYTNTFNDQNIEKLLEAFQTLSDAPKFNEIIQALNPYVFAANSDTATIKVSGDGANTVFKVANGEFSLADLKSNPYQQKTFGDLLKSKYHNIDANRINSSAYQKYLQDTSVLTTNAYTEEGEYFVQPLIEYKSLLPDTKTKEYTEAKNKVSDGVINSPQTDLSEEFLKAEKKNRDAGIINDEDIDDSGFKRIKQVDPLDRAKVQKFLDEYLPQLTLSDIDEVSKVKGSMIDAVGMYRNSVIYLFNGASTKTGYHEAFHGVFRNILSYNERESIYNDAARKYGKPSKAEIDHYKQELHPDVLKELDDIEVEAFVRDIFLEEKLADDFADYADSKLERGLGQKILDFFKRILQWFNIFNSTSRGDIDTLFENIMAKKFSIDKAVITPRGISWLNEPAYSRPTIGRLKTVTKNERVKSMAANFIKRYSDILNSGQKADTNEIYKAIYQEYNKIYLEESNKAKPSALKLNVLSEIIKHYDAFTDEVSSLIKTTLKVPAKVFRVEDHQAILENTADPEVNMEGNTTKGLGELTTKSGIDSASLRLKILFSTIPVVNKSGTPILDKYGFPQYHSYERIYYWLERHLVGLTDFDDMINQVKKASIFRPELGNVVEMLTSQVEGRSQEALKKLQNDFRANFAKQQMLYELVLFNKTKTGVEFKMVNSNREGVATEIFNQWINNMQIPGTDTITDFSKEDVIINGTKKAKTLYEKYKSSEATITAKQLEKILPRVGIEFSEGVISKVLESSPEEFKKHVKAVLAFYADETKNNILEKEGRKSIGALVGYELASNLNNYTSSLNNVEGKAVYTIQNPSWVSKVVGKLTGKESGFESLLDKLRKDPILRHSNLLTELETDPSYRSKFKILYLNGLKNSKGESLGSKFTKMASEDWLATQIALFQNNTSGQNITSTNTVLYTNVTPADKTLEILWEGKKYAVVFDGDGNIAPGSHVVDKFYNVLLGEANRIKKAQEHAKTLANDEFIQYYHFSGDKLRFDENNKPILDGSAFKFNMINGLEGDLYETIISQLAKDSDTKKALSPIKNKLKAFIAENLTKSYKKQTKEAIEKGIIEVTDVDGKKFFTPKTLQVTKTTTQDVHDEIKLTLAEFSTNSYLANIEYSNLINGDPAFYKAKDGKIVDLPKRFYQGQSTTISINDRDLPEIKVAVITDLEVATQQESLDVLFTHAKGVSAEYDKQNSINVTDAQVYVTPELYKKLKEARGIWTEEDELAANIAEGKVEFSPEAGKRLNAIKPFIYGTIFNEKLGVETPIQIKCSIMPLYKSLIHNNPLLLEHRDRMEKEGVGMLAVESAMKAFLPQRDNIAFSGDKYKSVVTISGEMFGFQVDNPDHLVDEENSSTRQIKMLLPGNIDPLASYGDKTGAAIIEEISNLESDNINEDLESLNKRTHSRDFNEDLSDVLTSRKATINTQKILTVDDNGDFAYPLDSINTTATENMLASVFTKKVVKQEFQGGSAVQASAAGFKFNTGYKNLLEQQEGLTPEALKVQSSLRWIRAKDKESIDYIECAMPAWTKDFFGTDGNLVDINSLPESIRTMITYRIPTEGYHSMMSIKVVSFLPAEVGNFMILPYEVTKQFGADFDFDKTFFIYRDFYKDKAGRFNVVDYIDGSGVKALEKRYKNYVNKTISKKANKDLYKEIIEDFEKYYEEPIESLSKNEKIQALTAEGRLLSIEEFSELSISRQNTKEARNNRIIDNYDRVLRSYNTLKYLAKPSGFDELSKIAKEIIEHSELSNFYEGDTQRFYKDLFHAIIGLKGQSANHVTGHSYFTMLNLTVGEKLAIKFNGKDYSNLSRLKSDSGNLISEELSTMMAAILDAVKNPDMLPSLGINDKTIDIWATLVHYGVGIEGASLFTSQPAIKDLSKALKQNEKKIKEIGYKFKDVSDIKTQYILELDSLLKKLNDPDFNALFENQALGYKGVSKGYSALTTKELLDYRKYKNSIGDTHPTTKEHAYYLAYQIRVLEAYKKLAPVSDSIIKINRFMTINKEVGPNLEDIIEKEALHNDITAYEFPIDGFFKEKIPQLNSIYKTHMDAKDYLSKYIPYASDLYVDVKNTVGLYQYKNDDTSPMLKMDSSERMLVNGFIKTFMDHSFPEFEKINSMAERKRIFREIPSLIASIKKSENDEKFFNGALRKNAFIDQLKVTFEAGLGFITLKGNRLTDIEKNNIIESGLVLYNHPETKKIFEDLILYSYLSSGFYTGFNSFHSLIPVEVLNTYGASDDTEGYMEVRRMAQEYMLTAKPLDSDTKDLLVDQLVRNFPKQFTMSYDQDSFSGFETNGKPDTIYAIENKAKNMVIRYEEEIDMNTQETKQIPVYKKYIRVYSNKYQGSLLYKNTSGSEFQLISYLGKKGFMIEVNSSEPIEVSAVDKNNYIHATEAESKPVKNPFASKEPDQTNPEFTQEGTTVEDNMALFGADETETPALENKDIVTLNNTETPKVGFLRKTTDKEDDDLEKGLGDLPDINKC